MGGEGKKVRRFEIRKREIEQMLGKAVPKLMSRLITAQRHLGPLSRVIRYNCVKKLFTNLLFPLLALWKKGSH